MPKRIRQLIAELQRAGFVSRGGKGSHRNFVHPKPVRVTLSGAEGEEAKHYQVREVERAIEQSREP